MNPRKSRRIVVLPLLALTLAAAAPDRSTPPAPGPTPRFDPPSVQKSLLRNGVKVYVAETHDVPVVTVDLWIRTGALSDPEGLPGLANLVADMLDEGAGGRTALEIADEIECLGASLSTSGGWEATSIHLYVPVERLHLALAIMADVALRPTFPIEDLDRLRKERLTTLLQWRDEPRSLSTLTFRRRVCGVGSRFGLPPLGTEEAIRAITPDDLARFHKAHFVPLNAAIVVVGDVSAATVFKAIEDSFGGWPRGDVPAPAKPHAAVSPEATSVTLVDRPGSAQTEIRIGTIGPPRSTPDYFALTLLNTVLGGSFTSRLQQNLREQHGYSYSAGSRFEMYRGTGLFYAVSAVQTAVTDSALVEFMKELGGIRGTISAEELSRATNNIALSFPGDFETTQQIAERISEIYLYDLPEDYFSRYIGSVMSVTLEDLGRVANRYLDPARMEVVLVGDREQIGTSVERLGMGTVRTLTVEDVLGKPPKV